MKVEPDYKSIGDLFRDANVFRVPKYQRGYAWKDSQLEDFKDDLIFIHENGAYEHFFGSLVCAQAESIGGHEKINQLVDGQQRLTTFVILICCLIKKYEALNQGENEYKEYIDEKIKELKERYLFYKKSVNKKTEYIRRLELSRRDDEFFNNKIKCIPVEASRDSHKRLDAAFGFLTSFIDDLTSHKSMSDSLDELDALEKTINEKCNIIHMVTDKVADAYKLFQVINDRGEQLNHTDLLRAKTLGITDDKDDELIFNQVENIWDKLDEDYGSSLEKLLGYYYSSHTGDKVKGASFYDQCMDRIFSVDKKTSPQIVFDKMRDIKKSLEKASLISQGEWPYTNSVLSSWQRSRLKFLIVYLKHTHCIPLLLAATNLKEKQFYEIVRVLEIFFFRYKNVCGNKIDLATTRYYKSCREISDGKFTVQGFKTSLRELVHKHAFDEVFKSRIDELDYSKSKVSLRYLLLGLEDSWLWYKSGMKEGVKGREGMFDYSLIFDFSSATVEHIYPQCPDVKDVNLEPLLNKLGNLTILGPKHNEELGNLPYSEKAKIYVSDTKLKINKEFENYPVWNKESLLERREELMNAACCIFNF
ncbi:DUF262 domain-containing protein [Grimontia hollisae]|uniref:DUF262 domain-containing protein n=1 Tax=Grimontia hollisae CIP 101886 TaxID=675812 RepID=D0I7T5_GRIHO|nr:DUF262 domain-containing protein [Grimontia hollisae]AMG31161.1 DUF262 domain-containing protein [Grimontia hollisae]EEY72704.1 hypothetical protein VHA_001809 [Grimontia hollisae CIP 101886]STO46487.1 Uncharacterized conserved protein [Grimontia hollisae]